MAERQYIGARYVPKFFSGAGGSAEWVANTQYEALTIVTRNGNSYTSKKPVPSSVGAPEENSDYWVSTGLYNEQIEAYRQEVESLSDSVTDIDGRVDTLEDEITPDNECYLFISDSYGGTYGNADEDDTTIWTELESKLNMTGRTYYCTFVASGFAYDPGNGNFLDKLQDNAVSISQNLDVNKITKVIVVAGRNDYLANSEAAVFTAMQAFNTYVKATYPNAKLYVGFIANGDNTSAGTKADLILKSYYAYRRCNEFGGVYLNGVEAAIHCVSGLSSDNIHPSATGKKQIANAIYEALKTGFYQASFKPATAVLTPRTGFGFVNDYELELNELVENNNLYTFSEKLVAGITIPTQSFTDSNEYTLTFADISGGYLLHPFGSVSIPVTVEIDKSPVVGKVIVTPVGGVAVKFRPNKSFSDVTALVITGYNSINVWPLVFC